MATLEKQLKPYQNIIISAVLLMICAGATMFAVIPAVSNVQSMLRDLRDLTEQTSALETKLTTLTSYDEDDLRAKLTNVLSAVPAERSFPTLFETVEGVAGQTGVSVLDMGISGGASLATPSATQISAEDKKLGTRTVPFTVSVNGTLAAVEQFITRIPSVRRLLRIRTFSINFPKTETSITVSLDMDAFYEPLPTNLGSVKSLLPTLTDADDMIISRVTDMPLVVAASGSLPPPNIGKIKSDPFAQ